MQSLAPGAHCARAPAAAPRSAAATRAPNGGARRAARLAAAATKLYTNPGSRGKIAE
jgi:hypothetical protein